MSLIRNGKKIAGLYKAEDLEHSTETHAGIIELATVEETKEGVDDRKAITPYKLKQVTDEINNELEEISDELSEKANDNEVEKVANKRATLDVVSDVTYPTTKLLKSKVDEFEEKDRHLQNEITVNSNKIKDIMMILEGHEFKYVTDDSEAYIKDVPQNSAEFADLLSIGGKNIVLNQLIDETKVIPIESTTSEVDVPSENITENAEIQMVGGMSRKGENLLGFKDFEYNYGGLNFKCVNNEIIINGTTTANISYWFANMIKKKPSSETFYKIVDASYGSGTIDSGGIELNFKIGGNNYSAQLLYGTRGNLSKCTSQNTGSIEEITIYFTKANMVINDLRIKLMVTNGDYYADYEPYTDQLVDAKVDEVVSVGVNLVEGSQDFSGVWLNGNYWNTSIEKFNDLVVKYYRGAWFGIAKGIYVEKGKTYTFSCFVKSDEPVDFRIYNYHSGFSDGTTSPYFKSFTSTTVFEKYSCTFNATESGVIHPRIEATTSGTNIYVCGYQLEEGTEATDYKPYRKITKPIPQAVQELDGYGIGISEELYNHLEFKDGKVLFHKRVGRVKLWELVWGKDEYGFNIFVPNKKYIPVGLALTPYSITIDLKYDYYLSTDKAMGFSGNSTKIWIRMDEFIDVPSFVKFLEDNNGVLDYELASEQVTDITNLFTEDWKDILVESNGTLEFHYPNKDLGFDVSVPNKVGYNYTQWNEPLDATHKYVYRKDGVGEIITNHDSQDVVGATDELFDLTKMAYDFDSIDKFNISFPNKVPFNKGEIVSGKVDDVISRGKNILDLEKSFIVNNESIIEIKSNYLKITNTSLSQDSTNFALRNLIVGKQYTLSFNTDTTLKEGVVRLFKDDSSFLYSNMLEGIEIKNSGKYSVTFIPQNSTTGLMFRNNNSASEQKTCIYSNIQLEEGSVVTSYSPYREPIHHQIPLAVQELDGYGWSAGDVSNEVDYANKKYIKRVGRIDLGTLDYTQYSTEVGSLFRTVNKYVSNNILCSKYVVSSYDNRIDKSIYWNRIIFNIDIVDSGYSTVEQFKQDMSGVYIYYELAEPEVIDISNILDTEIYLDTENGGTLEFHQQDETRVPVPSKVEYVVRLQEGE